MCVITTCVFVMQTVVSGCIKLLFTSSFFDVPLPFSCHSPAFIQLKFNSHESAWKAFLLLELALTDLTDNGHFFQLNWRKCTWYYDQQTRSREKRRNNQKYLNSIADKISADAHFN